MNARYYEIDVAKGIGILLVMLGHILPNNSFLRMIIYSFHMPLFFILSGLVIKNRSLHLLKEHKKFEMVRAFIEGDAKLLAAYICYSVFYILIDVIFRILVRGDSSILLQWDIIKTLTLWGINVLWFISAMIYARLIWRVVVSRNSNKRTMLIISIVLYLLGDIISDFLPSSNSLIGLSLSYIIVALLRGAAGAGFLILGYCIKDQLLDSKINDNKWLLLFVSALSFLLIIIFSYFMFKNEQDIDFHLLHLPYVGVIYLTGTIGSIATLAFSKFIVLSNSLVKQALSFWGCNTLLIMVTHEYLGIKEAIVAAFNLDRNIIGYLIEFIMLLVVETIIVFALGKVDNMLIKGIQSKICCIGKN